MEEHLQESATPDEQNEKKKKSARRELMEWLLVIVGGVCAALLISNFILFNARIPSSSMESTIMVGDRVIGLRFAYWFSEPERGDIVIFRYPDNEEKIYIKRVIGLPGETVEIIDGKVYIDGSEQPLQEDYVNGVPTGNYGPYVVPENSYFMLGDNRGNSEDSRFWTNKFVKKEKILAKAVVRYYPGIKLLTE